jgi:N6-L-threonylcarbamoyladenine synthase/protein kinase Bud32
MKILGIESTAHTFGAGVVDGFAIKSNERDMYRAEKGGIVPMEAAKHHRTLGKGIIDSALAKANVGLPQIEAIALSSGPGLPPCLRAGLDIARSFGKPIIEVNHCIAHIEVGRATLGCKDPLTVYVSGGNTQIIAHSGGKYRVFGETLDIGVGNAYDKFARSIGLEMPGGPKVEALAKEGKYRELPYTVKGMSLNYAGLVTAASRLAEKHGKADACFSFQETALSMLAEVAERALAHTKKKELLLTGGVAMNNLLREIMEAVAKEHDASFHVPEKQYCGDNGAMIAVAGAYKQTATTPEKADIYPAWRTDDVETTWIK